MERTFDAAWMNSIVNHPEIYPFVKGPLEGPLDMTAVLENHDNVVLKEPAGFGGWLFHCLGQGIYECHSSFLPEGRGPRLRELAAESLNWMFGNTDAGIILGRCPVNNEPVTRLTKMMGFKYIGTWGTWLIHGEEVPMARYQLTKETWTRIRDKYETN